MTKVWYAKNSNPKREVCEKVGKRQAAEWAIVSAFVKTALKAGHTLGVFDGEEVVLKHSSSYKAVMAAIMSTDDDYIFVYPVGATTGPRIGWVRLIYGNSGWDVISDYTTNLGAEEWEDGKGVKRPGLNLMWKADEVSDRLSARM
jgi:hypothetical protein